MIYAISIGTNTGNRLKNLEHALNKLHFKVGEVLKTSSVYKTQPWGFESKRWFYNAVFVLKSSCVPQILMQKLLEIEKEMGRVRGENGYTDRCIDLDIILFDDCIISSKQLILPHPKMHERLFVLLPLQEVMPQWIHPILKKNIEEMIRDCGDHGMVYRLENYKLKI